MCAALRYDIITLPSQTRRNRRHDEAALGPRAPLVSLDFFVRVFHFPSTSGAEALRTSQPGGELIYSQPGESHDFTPTLVAELMPGQHFCILRVLLNQVRHQNWEQEPKNQTVVWFLNMKHEGGV